MCTVIWSKKPVAQVKSDVMCWMKNNGVTNDTIRATSEIALQQFAWFVSDHLDMTPEEAVKNYNYGQAWGLRVDFLCT